MTGCSVCEGRGYELVSHPYGDTVVQEPLACHACAGARFSSETIYVGTTDSIASALERHRVAVRPKVTVAEGEVLDLRGARFSNIVIDDVVKIETPHGTISLVAKPGQRHGAERSNEAFAEAMRRKRTSQSK